MTFKYYIMKNIKMKSPIYSFTLKELLDNRDGEFIHHDKYTKELKSPVLLYAYANTLVFEIKSSKFGQKTKTKNGLVGTNYTKYKIFVLFEDFYTIGKDKDIPFEDAIDYAINYGDVHIRCTCPAHLYWGYAYIGTELKFLYGIPRENRYPVVRNPQVKGTICKHEDAVIQWILRNQELVFKMFAEYYNRLKDGQSIYAVNINGTTITIGHKNEEGDIFFEQQVEETQEEEMKDEEEIQTEESEEEDNVLNEEDTFGDPDWHIEDPTEGVIWDEEENE